MNPTPITFWRVIYFTALSIAAALLPVSSNAGNSAAADLTETNCSAKQVAKISISALNGAPIVIPIANGVPVTLMLDTGAERTVLTPEAAQRVRAQRPHIEFDRRLRGIRETLPMREIELERFTIGGVPIPWRRIAVASPTLPPSFFGALDGVLVDRF